jgi:peptidyl-prolyl cis-trans isomerase B (cyclophilin B)
VTSNRRDKQLAREKYERQQARRAQQAQARKRRQRIIGIAVAAVVVIVAASWVVVSRAGSTEEPIAEAVPSSAPSGSPAPSGSAIPSDSATPSSPAAPSASSAALSCAEPGDIRADNQSFPAAPQPSPLSQKPAVITLTTNCGPIAIETLPDAAPLTVASEVFLTEQGFYDKTRCHRLTTAGILVLQCGDPAGDGTGGPGYAVPDENLPGDAGVNYPAGTVAMANAGPGTSGSQFFIVYGDTTLPPGYTIWGKVIEGLDLVQQIADLGVEGGGGDGPPVQPVVIESASVSAA